jgi:hypothetical protein
MATNLLAGKGLLIPSVGPMKSPQYAHKTPLFALILAGMYAVFGHVAWPVIVLQILFSILATWAVYRLGGRVLRSRRAGWLAAMATALYPLLVLHDVQLMETTLYRALVVLLTVHVYRSGVRPAPRRILVTGIIAGVTVLVRTTVILFLPLAAVWLLLVWRRRILRLLPATAVAVVLFLLVLAPWFVRNYDRFGRIHLVTGGGRSFWIASGDEFLASFPKESVDLAENRQWEKLSPMERGRLKAVDEIGLDEELRKLADAALDADPGRFRRLALMKIGAAYSPVLNPEDRRDALDERVASLKQVVHLASYGPLLVIGAAGLLLLLVRRSSASALILLHYVAFTAFSVIFWAHSRHRYFLDVFLAAGAAYLLDRLLSSKER